MVIPLHFRGEILVFKIFKILCIAQYRLTESESQNQDKEIWIISFHYK
jgi:hypothetical protein